MNFKDYDKKDFCNPFEENAFAIELEVSYKDGDLWSDYKYESDKIIEFLSVHNLNTDDRLELLDKCQSIYEDKFPVGVDSSFISGGVHFLLFGDFSHLEGRFSLLLKNNLLNCPLYCKIDGSEFFTRYLGKYCEFDAMSYIGEDRKSHPVTLKEELYSNGGYKQGIEFRLNNVIDPRLLGYYQAQVLLFNSGIELEETKEGKAYLSKGDESSYIDLDYVDISDINGFKFSDKGEEVVKRNIKTIFNILEEKGLSKSKEALEEYLIERGFLENIITF